MRSTAPPPALTIRGRSISAFHLYGGAGLLAAAALAALLTARLDLSGAVVMTSAASALGIMLILAYASHLVLEREVLVSYHHLIVATVAAATVAQVARVPVVPHVAVFVVSLMMLQGIGRLGCLSVGCCHGRPSRWGVRYGAAHVAAGFSAHLADIPLVPVQAIEAAGAVTIGAAGAAALLHGSSARDVLLTVVAAYALQRSVAEFLRGDPDRLRIASVTEAQWTSLLLSIGATIAAFATHAPPRAAIAVSAASVALGIGVRVWGARHGASWQLFEPDHVLEMAGALAIVCGDPGVRTTGSARDLHVATTSRGISLSSSEVTRGVERARHYTMSRATTTLTEREAGQIATLVMQLRHAGDDSTLVRARRTGAFHLLVRGRAGSDAATTAPSR